MTSDHTSDEDRELDDPRLTLLADYTSGEMSREERHAFERRLAEDAEFREYCLPVLIALDLIKRHPERPPTMPREELTRHWNEFLTRSRQLEQGELRVPGSDTDA